VLKNFELQDDENAFTVQRSAKCRGIADGSLPSETGLKDIAGLFAGRTQKRLHSILYCCNLLSENLFGLSQNNFSVSISISPHNMSSGAEKLKNNKSIAILDAAEKGGYGIVSVVCVSSHHLFQEMPGLILYSV
jgi:hypothetical protein